MYIDIRWGDFETELKFTKEAGGLVERVVEGVSQALLEASEITKPYI